MMKRCLLISFVALTALLIGFNPCVDAQQGALPGQKGRHENLPISQLWQGKTFTRFTYEEEIKDTFRAMAQILDIPMTFSEGITETSTMEFKDMPLKDAFDFLIDQYDLAYTQDAHSIHVYKPGVGGLQDSLIRLENLEVEEVKNAIARFGLLKKEVQIHFDAPTSSIFVTGSGRDTANIKALIDSLEETKKKQLEARPEIRYFPLRYAKVSDIQLKIGKSTVSVPGLVNVLTQLLGLTRKGEDTSLPGVQYKENQPYPIKDISAARLIKGMIGAETGTITSDPRTNRIIIRDYPEKLDEYAEIIKQLDQPAKMVKIDVTIVEAGKDFARELGIGHTGWKESAEERRRYYYGTSGQARDFFNEQFTGTNLTPLTLIPLSETAAGTQISSYGLAGTFLYQGAQWTLASSLALAETRGISKTINKSSIITMDNMEAIVESKVTITYKIQTGGDSPTVEDEEIDAGIVLNVTPHIIDTTGGDRMIELVVNAERSSFLSTRTDGIPEKATTNLTTQAVIGDSATLVVGGFFENRYRKGETGIPCLMNAPGLGYLFKTAAATNPKSNILFFMTPTTITLDQIPYEGQELIEKIQKHEKDLKDIDADKGNDLIERTQE
jgi:type III secretion system YscC/HrcC family outer membrane pore protein